VSVGDDLDDGEAEPGAGAMAGRVGAGEVVKGKVQELGREAGTPVTDVELEPAVAAQGGQPHRPWP
jgi:hypothetical protein